MQGRRHRETWFRSLGREDPVKEGIVTHSSILARKVPQTEEPDGLWSMGLKTADMTEATTRRTPFSHRLFHPSGRMERENTNLKMLAVSPTENMNRNFSFFTVKAKFCSDSHWSNLGKMSIS